MKQREKLKKYLMNETQCKHAFFALLGHIKRHDQFVKPRRLLLNILDETGDLVSDHVWTGHRGIRYYEVNNPEIKSKAIKFYAFVQQYTRADGSIDFKFEQISNIEPIDEMSLKDSKQSKWTIPCSFLEFSGN